MSLRFFTDSALTRPITAANFKRVCIPLSGGSKITTVFLGDSYYSMLAQPTVGGDSSIYLDDTSEFLNSGTAILNGTSFTYSGKTVTGLTGCSGVPAAPITSKVTPSKVYKSGGNIVISPLASGFPPGLTIQLSASPAGPFGFEQSNLIMTSTSLAMGVALPVSIKVNLIGGVAAEFEGWGIASSPFVAKDASDNSAVAQGQAYFTAVMSGYAYRGDQSPALYQRIIQLNREIVDLHPGFTIGQYRWKPEGQVNAVPIVPSSWSYDPLVIGTGKFQSGIGYGEDLFLENLVNVDTSIYPQINSGDYFYLPFRNYLPVNTMVDTLEGGGLKFNLSEVPTEQTPIQVGAWKLDSTNTYVPYLLYTYVATTNNPDGSPRTDLPDNYFLYNRSTNTLSINVAPPAQTAFLGHLTGTTQTFDLPYYPIDQVVQAYCDYGAGGARALATLISLDPVNRKITVTIPNGNPGDNVYVDFPGALAAIYDTGSSSSYRLETSVDLNPAYAGISNGYYYIEQRVRKTEYITLSCDKPLIDIPLTFSQVANIIAYGPVYLRNDYALLTGQAFTATPNEIMPNARLLVVPADDFTGYINYQDPTQEQIVLVTGGDGKTNAIYTPAGPGGYYIPASAASNGLAGLATTTVTNDTLILPVGISIAQLWNPSDGWSIYTYKVFNDKPFYGQVNADLSLGEIPYTTTGTVGTTDWTTNGMIVNLTNGADIVFPIDALDTNNKSYTDPAFNGIAVKLIYSSSLPTASNVPALFINFLQRVSLRLQDIDTGVYSNPIVLQLEFPTPINDNPWLILNDAESGILNSFRLGWITPGK